LRTRKLKKFETTKLFWDEYLYKLVIHNKIARIFRNKNLSYAKQVLETLKGAHVNGLPLCYVKSKRQDFVKESQYLDAEKLLTFFSANNKFKIRVESTTLNIYSNDKTWLESIAKIITPNNVTEFWEPQSSSIEHLLEKTIILEEKINYEFRLTLGNKRGSQGFAQFARKNPHLVRAGPVLLKEMENQGWVSGMYFYARDEKVIQLCHIMLDNIRRIDKVIYKQDIDKY
jgi:hypothetical protein